MRLGVSLALSFLVAACICGHQNGAGPVPMPTTGNTTTYSVKVGASLPLAPGQQVGYALTATALRTYQFRWTGDAAVTGDGYREFYGSVWTPSSFASVTPGCLNNKCPLEQGDYVSPAQAVPGGQRIDWDTFASDGWDGFSFTTSSEPIFFDVLIDGLPRPNLFFFPDGSNAGAPANPAATPFAIVSTP